MLLPTDLRTATTSLGARLDSEQQRDGRARRREKHSAKFLCVEVVSECVDVGRQGDVPSTQTSTRLVPRKGWGQRVVDVCVEKALSDEG